MGTNKPDRVDVNQLMERLRFLERERQRAVSLAAQLRSENASLRQAMRGQPQKSQDERMDRVERQMANVEYKLNEILRILGNQRAKPAMEKKIKDETLILPYE